MAQKVTVNRMCSIGSAQLDERSCRTRQSTLKIRHKSAGHNSKNMFNYTKAEKLYNLSISKKKDYFNSYVNFGNLKRDLNKFDEAITLYKRALKHTQKLPEIYYSLAMAYQSLGNFKEAEDSHRSGAIQKLVPRALWWFRWAAMFTFLTGVVLLGALHAHKGGFTYDITIGAVLGTLMFLNVWLIIWPAQKIVIASATQVAQGGEALPEAAAAAPRAALASRTNVLFSAPMLFLMGSSAHLTTNMLSGASTVGLIAILLLIFALEANAIFGKQGPMTKVREGWTSLTGSSS